MLGVAAIVALGLGASQPVSSPAIDRVQFERHGPPACADETALRARVAAYLAQSARQDSVAARLDISLTQPTVAATLELTTATGHSSRTLHAATCEELVDAVALVVAMAIDPDLSLDLDLDLDGVSAAPSEPEPSVAPATIDPPPTAVPPPIFRPTGPLAPPPPEPLPSPTVRRAPRRATTRAMGWAGAGVTGGLLPSAGAMIEGGAGMQWRWLRVAAVGHYAFARSRPVGDGGSVVLDAWGLGTHACYASWPVGRIELAGCAVLEGGQVRGQGRGLPATDSNARPWLGAGARLGFDVRIRPRLFFTAAVQGLAHALVPTFHVVGAETVHQASAIAGRALVGLSVRLP